MVKAFMGDRVKLLGENNEFVNKNKKRTLKLNLCQSQHQLGNNSLMDIVF